MERKNEVWLVAMQDDKMQYFGVCLRHGFPFDGKIARGLATDARGRPSVFLVVRLVSQEHDIETGELYSVRDASTFA